MYGPGTTSTLNSYLQQQTTACVPPSPRETSATHNTTQSSPCLKTELEKLLEESCTENQGFTEHERLSKTNKTDRGKFKSTRVCVEKGGLNDCGHK